MNLLQYTGGKIWKGLLLSAPPRFDFRTLSAFAILVCPSRRSSIFSPKFEHCRSYPVLSVPLQVERAEIGSVLAVNVVARATESGAFKRNVWNGSYVSINFNGTESFYMHRACLDSLVNPSARMNQLATLMSAPLSGRKGVLLNKYSTPFPDSHWPLHFRRFIKCRGPVAQRNSDEEHVDKGGFHRRDGGENGTWGQRGWNW